MIQRKKDFEVRVQIKKKRFLTLSYMVRWHHHQPNKSLQKMIRSLSKKTKTQPRQSMVVNSHNGEGKVRHMDISPLLPRLRQPPQVPRHTDSPLGSRIQLQANHMFPRHQLLRAPMLPLGVALR